MDGVITPYRLTKKQQLTVTPCPYQHWRPVFGPSCTKFVFTGSWHFDNGAKKNIEDFLIEHDGGPNVLPLTVHL